MGLYVMELSVIGPIGLIFGPNDESLALPCTTADNKAYGLSPLEGVAQLATTFLFVYLALRRHDS